MSARSEHRCGTAGQCDHRTLRRQHPPRTPRPHPDHQPAACRSRAPGISTPLQQPPAAPRPRPSRSPMTTPPAHHPARRTASDGGTGSRACFTSISRSHDVSRVSGTHTAVHLGYALDLLLLVPGYATASVLLWRRAPWGYVLATVLLGSGVGSQLDYMTALPFQVAAGVPGSTMTEFLIAAPISAGEPYPGSAWFCDQGIPADAVLSAEFWETHAGYEATRSYARGIASALGWVLG